MSSVFGGTLNFQSITVLVSESDPLEATTRSKPRLKTHGPYSML
jgi:hypothetical protein